MQCVTREHVLKESAALEAALSKDPLGGRREMMRQAQAKAKLEGISKSDAAAWATNLRGRDPSKWVAQRRNAHPHQDEASTQTALEHCLWYRAFVRDVRLQFTPLCVLLLLSVSVATNPTGRGPSAN